MRTLLIWLVAVGWLVSASVGCDEPAPEAEPEQEQVAPEPEPEPVAEVEEVEPSEQDLPIAEDFADEVEAAITADNYVAQLDETTAELEAELAAAP